MRAGAPLRMTFPCEDEPESECREQLLGTEAAGFSCAMTSPCRKKALICESECLGECVFLSVIIHNNHIPLSQAMRVIEGDFAVNRRNPCSRTDHDFFGYYDLSIQNKSNRFDAEEVLSNNGQLHLPLALFALSGYDPHYLRRTRF